MNQNNQIKTLSDWDGEGWLHSERLGRNFYSREHVQDYLDSHDCGPDWLQLVVMG